MIVYNICCGSILALWYNFVLIFVCLIIIYYCTKERKEIPNCAVPKNIHTNPPQKRLEFPKGKGEGSTV